MFLSAAAARLFGDRGNISQMSPKKKTTMESPSASEIEQSTEKLLRDLKEVVEDGEELLRTAGENVSERSIAARDKLAAALDVAKETQRRLQERAVAGAQAADRLVRDYPYQSLGLAFGLGLLVGVLAVRR